ncbi:MAG: hypothetical protein K1X94_32525, partial [Sandaracinaceae bacterium]|nr:hypothetical protein [Sandaracinaceae bacterium]
RGRLSLVAFAAALALPDRSRAHQVIERDLPLAARALRALALRDEPSARRAMDAVLVALADHELNASTFAARVTAIAGADLQARLAAGLAAVSGPRHGGACDRVEALVHEVGTEHGSTRRLTSAVEAVIDARLGRGEAVAGFGHPLYPAGDPRARVLLAVARDLVRERGERGSSRAARTMLAIVDHMASIGGEPPSVDAGSVAITLALGAPRGTSAALFALGRTAGWVAHVLEQRGSATLLRPRARFTGASAGAGFGVSSAG